MITEAEQKIQLIDACMVSKLIVRVYGIEYVRNGRMQVRLEDVGNVCVPYLENCSSIA